MIDFKGFFASPIDIYREEEAMRLDADNKRKGEVMVKKVKLPEVRDIKWGTHRPVKFYTASRAVDPPDAVERPGRA
jgi:hypothetical protein